MENWKEKDIKLGRLPAKVPESIVFEYTGEGTYASSSTSCGCTTASWNANTNTLHTQFTPNAVSPILKANGTNEYVSAKTVTVTMIENGMPVTYSLTLQATVYE